MAWEPGKPSQNENEYFARQDEDWKRKRRAELDAERAAKEKETPKLQCPRCDGHLGEKSFNDVIIDVCEKCRGVWLDGGEIEMLAHVSKGQLQFLINSINDT